MDEFNKILLSAIQEMDKQNEFDELGQPNTYFVGGEILTDKGHRSDKYIINDVSLMLIKRDDLLEAARPLVLLKDASYGVLMEVIRDYFNHEPAAEEVRQEVLRIYKRRVNEKKSGG